MNLPTYDQLPVSADQPPGSSWGLWGDHDVFGCLNLLTPERVLAAAGCIRRGAVFRLDLDLATPDPPLFGRSAYKHEVSGTGEIGHDDSLSDYNTQSSSQWDGFRHIRNPVHGFYGGVADESHGIHHWAERGIVGRAVLADVGRWRASVGRPLDMNAADPIEPSELLDTLQAQGSQVETGDVLLIRTGWVGWYRTLDGPARQALAVRFASPGLRPGEATARLLWDLHVAAVAADNPALELWPITGLATDAERSAARSDPSLMVDHFVHLRLLPLLGLPIGELWDFEGLADDCASDGVYHSFLTSAPLNVPSGVASPPNAYAIK